MSTAEDTAVWEHSLEISQRLTNVRQLTELLCEPLSVEDCVVQSMPDASPIRWHLAHTTWFFETFLLKKRSDYRPYHDDFEFLFNSYYNSVGKQFARENRGLITRPSLEEIWAYRQYVDRHLSELLDDQANWSAEAFSILELGIQHEQQHQELMLTDIKHALSCNPLLPSYACDTPSKPNSPGDNPLSIEWYDFPEGIDEFGHDSDSFAFDNELPRHRGYLHDFRIAARLTTAEEFLAFIDDGGYRRPEFWLSMGWAAVQENKWDAPLYWTQRDGNWYEFTLAGKRPLSLHSPVCHVSYFEADAFARWSGKRLPTEFEWERATQGSPVQGNFVEQGLQRAFIHPVPNDAPTSGARASQMFGDAWEWTASQYLPYPGYKPAPGAIGEYNGKFMCNQFVLRGGSCASSTSHIRNTYRNFFPPNARWQFTGIRLAD